MNGLNNDIEVSQPNLNINDLSFSSNIYNSARNFMNNNINDQSIIKFKNMKTNVYLDPYESSLFIPTDENNLRRLTLRDRIVKNINKERF